MFGQRQLGGFLSRQESPGAVNNPAEEMIHSSGSLTGTERFLRGNRRLNDFIGTDMGDARSFVGVTQARQAAHAAGRGHVARAQPSGCQSRAE